NPCRIQSPSVLAPMVPFWWERSRLTRAKAPGAPVLPSGNVVLDVGPKQGQPGPASIGCSLLTVIGATQRASAGCAERAAAFACTLVESIEKSLAKKPGAFLVTLTITVSFVV